MFFTTSKYLKAIKRFSARKVLDVLVLVALLLSSCGPLPTNTATTPTNTTQENSQPAPVMEDENDYVPPEYTHPEPVVVERQESDPAMETPVDEEYSQGVSETTDPSVTTPVPTGDFGLVPTPTAVPTQTSPALSRSNASAAEGQQSSTVYATQASDPPSIGGRGFNPDTFYASFYNSSDLRFFLLNRKYEQVLDFELTCFTDSDPSYAGCKLIPELSNGRNWSVRWQGTLVVPQDGQYTFRIFQVDDGARIFIDGTEVVDWGWYYPYSDHHPSPQTVTLTEGPHNLIIDYEQRIQYAASLELRWSGPSFDEEIIPFADNVVSGDAVLNSCNVPAECYNSESHSQGTGGRPINTRTGGQFYQTVDFSIPTSVKPLSFLRTYSSLATDLYSTSLGYGWTHSLDTRLIFPDDPNGEAGYILFKAHTANRYQFIIKSDSTYMPAPGVAGTLTYANEVYTIILPDQSVYTFNADGQLQTWADAEGHTWLYSYDTNDRLEQVGADGGTHSLSLGYDEQGRIISVSDYAERTIEFSYDAAGDLVSATSLAGGSWQYQYDAAHHLTRVIDPAGNTKERTEYDAEGRAVRQYDGLDNLIVELTYNADGTTTITDVFEKSETHTYDERHTLTSDTDPLGGATDKTYDHNFRPVTITDADGDTTFLTWSLDGANLTRVVDAKGGQTDITYDALNKPISVVDPLNYLTTYEYNGTLLTNVTNALNEETTFTYTPEGFLESVQGPLQNPTTYTYDEHGQRTSVTDALGNTWEYSYDSLGRLVDTTDPQGRVTHNEYDVAGRLVRVTQNYDLNRPENDENQWNIVTKYAYDLAGNQISVTDTFDRITRYEYDAEGHLIKAIDMEGNATTSTYDEAGRLIATTDALQHTTTYTYDDAGRLIAISGPLGSATSATYNPDGTVASTSDALGRTTSYTYDDLQRVLTVIQPGGGSTQNTYDAVGNLIAVTDPLGKTTEYEYDALGRVIKTLGPHNDETTENFYDAAGRLIQTKDARGYTTTYTYNEAGQQTRVTDHLGNATIFEYDGFGRRLAVVDANGNRTEYTYDILDRVVLVTSPYGETHTEYDALGQVLSRTDANGNAVTYIYDDLGRVVSETDAMGGTTSLTYDVLGNRLSTTDTNDNTTDMTYDDLNRLVTVRDPLENVTTTVYDVAGQVIETIDAAQHSTTFTYDELGQQISVADPLGNTVQYTYDAAGRMTSTMDANGIVTAFEYDEAGRLTAVMENYKAGFQPDAQTNVRTEYTYDENGNRLTIKDGNGNLTSFTYDELNRLITEKDALDHTWQYTYDAVGNRISMTDANGQVTSYDYNDVNQLQNIDYGANGSDVAFTYDAVGRRTEMTDSVGTTRWTYDELNRPITITDPFGTDVQYGYDAVGNRASISYPGQEVNYDYDEANRLIRVEDRSKVTQYEYDPTGRLSAILRPNGVDSTYTYDVAGRLTELVHGTTESELASYQYTYDGGGNRTQAVERVQTAGAGPTVRLTVVDTTGVLQAEIEVYAFSGDTYTGFHQTTDANGQVAITLPQGDYRFRVDIDGTQFWSGPSSDSGENHCTIGQCSNLLVTIPTPVLVTVNDSEGTPRAGINVYAFNGEQYTGHHGLTNENGELSMRLPEGNYRFRADFNGTQFWSGPSSGSGENHCAVPGCSIASITVTLPVTVTVLDNINMPHEGISVYAFNGTTYSGYTATTDANGQVQMTLPAGDYRFRADFNGTQFWSGAENHCTIPTCSEAGIAVTLPLVVTVLGTDGAPQEGLPVYAFDGTSYTGYNSVTDADGRATFTLPQGSYRFRADFNGTQFWSNPSGQNHCTVPDCTGAQISVTSSTTVTVLDTDGAARGGVSVSAFNGTSYTGYHSTTDEDGRATFTIPQGSYRFRADYNGTQFWSGSANHCDIPGCAAASVTVTNGILVTVQNTDGAPGVGLRVYAFNGTTYTGYNATTDANGQATFTLPQGSYRFRADLNGTQFWSGASNHCDVPGCGSVSITVTDPMPVTVLDTDGAPQSGLRVYAFNGATYTGYNKTTDANGQAVFTLPLGSYRFRADLNGTQFWSGAGNHCALPGCESAEVTVSIPVTVTVQDGFGALKSGVTVYAFNGTTYTGYSKVSDANGQAIFTLPLGAYRFRADYSGVQYWSETSNHCAVPGCLTASVIVGPQPTATNTPLPTPTDTPAPTSTESSTPEPTTTATPLASRPGNVFTVAFGRLQRSAAKVEAAPAVDDIVTDEFDSDSLDSAWTWVEPLTGPTWSLTNNPDFFQFTVPPGYEHWEEIDTAPTLRRTDMGGGNFAIETSFSFDENNLGGYQLGLVVGFSETDRLWMGVNEDGTLHVQRTGADNYQIGVAALPVFVRIEKVGGEFTFLYKQNAGDDWTHLASYSTYSPVTFVGLQGRTYAAENDITYNVDYFRLDRADTPVTDPNDVLVYILNTMGDPQSGLHVYVFDDTTYTGYSGVTDEHGQIMFTLPDGSYRFRADFNGTQFWSDDSNHCDIPGCNPIYITVTEPVEVQVFGPDGADVNGLNVYAFADGVYAGYHQTTDQNGIAVFTLPEGNYRFRSDFNGTQFWSTWPEEGCVIPDCALAAIELTAPVIVTVLDTDSTPKEGLNVYAFDGTTYTGYSKVTDANGQAAFTLPYGIYRFRADLNGTQFWSGAENHCDVYEHCVESSIAVTKPVTVTVLDEHSDPYADLAVYTFDGTIYTGYHSTTDANGQAVLTLPEGNYHFRADLRGTQFWSNTENDCAIPGCESAQIGIPGGYEYGEVTIDYTYDPLYRLTAADYSTGDYYHYDYDAVGNRLTEQTHVQNSTYVYDDANRLASVNGVPYTWDNNGNLLNDGMSTYTYDPANRLKQLVQGENTYTYSYNGMGDRLSQNGIQYTLDLNAGLTQVLNDGTNTYLYGLERIAQVNDTTTEYFLGDALGSVRQLTNTQGNITLTQSYTPYGSVMTSVGDSESPFAFTGEQLDPSGLTYLRARYYDALTGRFTTRDTYEGDVNTPASLNRFNYAHSNPVMYTDPSGHCIFAGVDTYICGILTAGFVGGVTGAALGGVYAAWMYHLADTGKCGCEGQQLITQYTRGQFILKGIAVGAVFGAVFGALAASGLGGAALAALGGIGFSTAGIINSIRRLQVDPHNECAWWDLGISIVGLVASAGALRANSIRMFYNKAIKNPASSETLIGRYDATGSSSSYENQAASLGFKHLNLKGAVWQMFKGIFGEKAWWKLINEPFMRAVAKTKEPVYVNMDPRSVTSGNLASEIKILTEAGYIDDGMVTIKGIQLWKMIHP